MAPLVKTNVFILEIWYKSFEEYFKTHLRNQAPLTNFMFPCLRSVSGGWFHSGNRCCSRWWRHSAVLRRTSAQRGGADSGLVETWHPTWLHRSPEPVQVCSSLPWQPWRGGHEDVVILWEDGDIQRWTKKWQRITQDYECDAVGSRMVQMYTPTAGEGYNRQAYCW